MSDLKLSCTQAQTERLTVSGELDEDGELYVEAVGRIGGVYLSRADAARLLWHLAKVLDAPAFMWDTSHLPIRESFTLDSRGNRGTLADLPGGQAVEENQPLVKIAAEHLDRVESITVKLREAGA